MTTLVRKTDITEWSSTDRLPFLFPQFTRRYINIHDRSNNSLLLAKLTRQIDSLEQLRVSAFRYFIKGAQQRIFKSYAPDLYNVIWR